METDVFFLDDLPDPETMDGFARRYPEMEVDTTAACLRLFKVASHLLREVDTHFAGHGLSTARFLVLVVLERVPGKRLMAVEIARQLGISKKNTARVLTLMETDGLVHRAAHETDGRASMVSPTLKGLDLLDASLPGYYRVLNRALRPLGATAKARLIGLLDLIDPTEADRRRSPLRDRLARDQATASND